MERRPRGIPVAKFRTQEAKTRSQSRVREPDYNEQDPEHDLFTLLEDNIALKEENKALKLEIEEHKKQQSILVKANNKLNENLITLKTQQSEFEQQMKELNIKYAKAQSERNALDKLRQLKADEVKILTSQIAQLQQTATLATIPLMGSVELKRNVLKILPAPSNSSSNEMESIIDVDAALELHITSELVERLVEEFFALKNTTNATELQLYEANEKIAELVENQHHLDEENETLRAENTNLTKVAKLLTENMKESVETSKKMEVALIKLKQRNDELTAKTRDLTDSQPSSTTVQSSEEFEQIKEEVQQQTRDQNERVVEMQNIMVAAIEKSTNDELKKLQLQLEILEEQLRLALARAESAETELEKYKFIEEQQEQKLSVQSLASLPPPPPPPPMPNKPLYQNNAREFISDSTFTENIAVHHLQNKIINNVKKQQVTAQQATGFDALVREFKSGRVTLRRHRRKIETNEALQEMFQALEISQKQNRNSKICIDMQF